MANFDMVLPYTEELAQWIASQAGTAPPVQGGNRDPTRAEVVEAVAALGLALVREGDEDLVVGWEGEVPAPLEPWLRPVVTVSGPDWSTDKPPDYVYLVRIHCLDWERLGQDRIGLSIYGQNLPLELLLLHTLSRHCGQLVLYPDTGDPPVVVDAESDPLALAERWYAAVGRQDSWAAFYGEGKAD